jgi:hypothetical protein
VTAQNALLAITQTLDSLRVLLSVRMFLKDDGVPLEGNHFDAAAELVQRLLDVDPNDVRGAMGELRFHVGRLDRNVRPSVAEEAEHLAQVRAGYAAALAVLDTFLASLAPPEMTMEPRDPITADPPALSNEELRTAMKWLGVLRNYQQARMERERPAPEPSVASEAFTEEGA